MLWESYKERLETTDNITMLFDLKDLITQVDGLEWLHNPFTQQEIDKVV